MHRNTLSVLLVFFVFSGVGFGKALNLEGTKTRVEFLAVGNPSALKIKGATSESDARAVRGQLAVLGDKVTGTASCKLDTLDTGIETRNKHMKEKYLEVGKYPDAKIDFTVEGTSLIGTLDLHGVKKPITGKADVAKDGDRVKANFEFKLKVSDYAIASPSFMGITMADEVTVKVNTEGELL